MILSMTGFGKAACQIKEKALKIELRALNSKNLDMAFKVPSAFREKEHEIRSLIGNKLKRGKVELLIGFDAAESALCSVNKEMLRSYYLEVKSVYSDLGETFSPDMLPALLRLPDVLKNQVEEPDEQDWKNLMVSISEAVDQLMEYRRSEGEHMADDFKKRENIIRQLLKEVEAHEGNRIKTIRERIRRSLSELGEDVKIDENRFEQELIYFLEKLDITEEKVRLVKHLDYFLECMQEEESNGKKLGFIAQEMGREINTIGSKANNAEIQKVVVQMKDELEKIKEQLMNIL